MWFPVLIVFFGKELACLYTSSHWRSVYPFFRADEENENKKTTPIIKDESNASSKDMQDDDDNLFDLIDSMYEEKGA